ncbi:hypothetical protein [Nocardiopsis ganjiahuensis]|uniref:hypothetical protein n=1 Tax=Nocardiopsis ganjiahuensis TaxID=239984 RepID=UPI0003465D6E|nr:hypothetical protein [Nocardiopsis ganjiahuensis]
MRASEADPDRAPEPVPAPEPGGDEQPLPVFRGLVTLGTEDAPACSDGICF